MKLTHFAGKILFVSLIVLSLGSCNKDKESPTIKYNEPFMDNLHYYEGTWFKVEAFIDDDAGLVNYKSFVTDSTGAFSYVLNMADTAEVEGTGFLHRDSIVLPLGSQGWYNYNIVAEDGAGNVTTLQRLFFVDP